MSVQHAACCSQTVGPISRHSALRHFFRARLCGQLLILRCRREGYFSIELHLPKNELRRLCVLLSVIRHLPRNFGNRRSCGEHAEQQSSPTRSIVPRYRSEWGRAVEDRVLSRFVCREQGVSKSNGLGRVWDGRNFHAKYDSIRSLAELIGKRRGANPIAEYARLMISPPARILRSTAAMIKRRVLRRDRSF